MFIIQREYDKEYSRLNNIAVIAQWNFSTNVTEENKYKKAEAYVEVGNISPSMSTHPTPTDLYVHTRT